MTPEVEKKRRELFEEKVELPPTVRWDEKHRCYTGSDFWVAEFGWDALNAALDAVEIVLPPSAQGTDGQKWLPVEAVEYAITATGLGLRVK